MQTLPKNIDMAPSKPQVWRASVRGYEVDLLGIVNNACYMNYLDQARIEALAAFGIDWAEFHEQGFDIVLFESNLKWQSSLKNNQPFRIETSFKREGKLKIKCQQIIIREDGSTVLAADNTIVCIRAENQRPCFPKELGVALGFLSGLRHQ